MVDPQKTIYYDKKFMAELETLQGLKLKVKLEMKPNSYVTLEENKKGKILKLENLKDIEEFEKIYGKSGDRSVINWKKVAKDYNGIDVYTFNKEKIPHPYFVGSWLDCEYFSDGGILWKYDNIKSIKVINFKEVKIEKNCN